MLSRPNAMPAIDSPDRYEYLESKQQEIINKLQQLEQQMSDEPQHSDQPQVMFLGSQPKSENTQERYDETPIPEDPGLATIDEHHDSVYSGVNSALQASDADLHNITKWRKWADSKVGAKEGLGERTGAKLEGKSQKAGF